MKKLCQVNPTAKTNRLWNYRLPEHFDCIQFLISHPVVPSHCVECRVSLKADFISGMWSSIYKCTSLLNSSVINIAHQYCMDTEHPFKFVSPFRFKRIQLWSMHLYRGTFLACLLIEWIVCSSGSLLWGKSLPANAVILNVAVVTNLDLWTFLQIWLRWMM